MILVGTVHMDIEGTARLEHILNITQPRTITIEWSGSQSVDKIEQEIRTAREYMLDRIASWEEVHPCIQELLMDLLSQRFYEAFVPLVYAKEHLIAVHPIDLPDLVTPGLPEYMDAIRETITPFLKNPPTLLYKEL